MCDYDNRSDSLTHLLGDAYAKVRETKIDASC